MRNDEMLSCLAAMIVLKELSNPTLPDLPDRENNNLHKNIENLVKAIDEKLIKFKDEE